MSLKALVGMAFEAYFDSKTCKQYGRHDSGQKHPF